MNEFGNGPKIYENKRVVLITGDASKWYEQAIFIVKKNTLGKNLPMDFIKEAENIIERYLSSDGAHPDIQLAAPSRSGKTKTRFGFAMNLLMLTACVAIFAMIGYRYLL